MCEGSDGDERASEDAQQLGGKNGIELAHP